jgi:hypothetical protein
MTYTLILVLWGGIFDEPVTVQQEGLTKTYCTFLMHDAPTKYGARLKEAKCVRGSQGEG